MVNNWERGPCPIWIPLVGKRTTNKQGITKHTNDARECMIVMYLLDHAGRTSKILEKLKIYLTNFAN